MSLIFEGVDGVGKTTNIQQFILFNRYYMYLHNWTKPKNTTDILSETTKEILLLDSNHNIIFDRSFIISEYVYAHVLRRKTPVTLEYVQELIKLVNRKGHTIKLFYFKNFDSLRIKEEDKDLPFEELNKLYLNLFTSQVKVNKLILENIDER